MPTDQATPDQRLARKMTHYMAWANRVMFESVARLPAEEITRERPTLFGNIAHTFNHIFVVADIFRAHLEGRAHGYGARNTETAPPFEEVRAKLEAMDGNYVALAARLSQEELDEVIRFTFVGGGEGAMTRLEILLHLVNHATYHRGFISDMLYQLPVPAPRESNDFPVFLRDAWPEIQARLEGESAEKSA